MTNNELWAALGSLPEQQAYQVLIELFTRYEQRRERHPGDPEVENFFNNLNAILAQVQSCNVSRR